MMQYLQHDGVNLAYHTSGAGSPVVLVHGWCDNHQIMSALAGHVSAQHHVVSYDLRGHGQSDKPKTPYTMATFADDLAFICTQLDLQHPLIIGHSLGGAIALELAACYPHLPAAIVAIEGMILVPDYLREGLQPFLDALHGPEWRAAMHGFVEENFSPTDDPELQRAALAELDHLPQHMHISVTEQTLLWDAAAAARNCWVPVLYIEGGSGLSDLHQFKTLCPQLVIGQTVYVGHNQMVATPAQAVAMIERFAAVGSSTIPTTVVH